MFSTTAKGSKYVFFIRINIYLFTTIFLPLTM